MPPSPMLMESLRAVGYSMETAVSDIVDNSIAAGATTIRIHYSGESFPYLAVLDDGKGMSAHDAAEAMRLAARSPLGMRSGTDLGRFGLGLKTASLSQCRRLTVISKDGSQTSGVRWDLDYLASGDGWTLLTLDDAEIRACRQFSALDAQRTGTLVLWENLDQIPPPPMGARVLDEQMAHTRQHLSLVFHRFLAGEGVAPPVHISLNDNPIEPADPYLATHRATQRGHQERIELQGERIDVQPFTLPHITKLSATDKAKAQVSGRLRDSQGFYIYRGRRLVIWGTWFRLVPKDDLGKLARVRVDIPNTLDHLWSLDIKKSAAVPPEAIKEQLRRTVDRILGPSRTVHLYRGRKVDEKSAVVRFWNVIEERGAFRYEINRDHPALAALSRGLDPSGLRLLEQTVQGIQESFPIEDAHNRLAADGAPVRIAANDDELLAYARALWLIFTEAGRASPDFVEDFKSVEPFAGHPHAEALLRKASG